MCHYRSHLTAGFSTPTTRLGTATAMIVIMLFTFSRTAIAGFSTNSAQLNMKVRITSHKTGAKSTSISAVAASFDTLSHHLHHVTVKTGSRAIFTVTQASKTSLNAGFKDRVMRLRCGHKLTPENILKI
jgi:hypothetical protein